MPSRKQSPATVKLRASLVKLDACDEAQTWIRENGHLTPSRLWATCPRADWREWIMGRAGVRLTGPARTEYEGVRGTALAECAKVRGAARAEYEKAIGTALAECAKVRGAPLAEYDKVRDPALSEYQKVYGAAWAEYQKAIGTALARLLPWSAIADKLP